MRTTLPLLTLLLVAACGGSERYRSTVPTDGPTAADPTESSMAEEPDLLERIVDTLPGRVASEVCTTLQYAHHEALTSSGVHNVRCVYDAFHRTAEECFEDEAYCLYECGFWFRRCRLNYAPNTPRDDSRRCVGLQPQEYEGCAVTVEELTSCFGQFVTANSVLAEVSSCEEAAATPQPPVTPECEAVLSNPGCATVIFGR